MNRLLPGNWNAYVFIIVSSILLMVVVANLPFRVKPFGDINFHQESRTLALFLKGHADASQVKITQAPGPVLFYTPAYVLAPAGSTDDRLWINGVAMTTLLLTVAMLLLYRTALTVFSRKAAILTVALFMAFPMHCYYSLGIVGEVPAFFSLSVALYGWARCLENPGRNRGYALLALGLLLLVLNRPNSILVLLTIPLVVGFSYFKAKTFYYRHARRLLAVFASTMILGMGTLRLAKEISGTRNADSQENLLYYVLHEGRFQFREEPLDWRYWDDKIRHDSRDHANWKKSHAELHNVMVATHRKKKDVYKEWLIADALENPVYFVRQFFIKAIYGHVYVINSVTPQKFSMGPFSGPGAYFVLHIIINLVNVVILAGAVIFAFREKNHLRIWIFWSAILALIAFHALSYMEPRYLFPSKAALFMISAAGLLHIPAVSRIVSKVEKLFYPSIKPIWKAQSR